MLEVTDWQKWYHFTDNKEGTVNYRDYRLCSEAAFDNVYDFNNDVSLPSIRWVIQC